VHLRKVSKYFQAFQLLIPGIAGTQSAA